MPYPESCPECGNTFRNTGTHFTARRNEVGRHVLLELGCQNTTRRFWWDFTTGNLTEDGRPSAARGTPQVETMAAASVNNGALHAETNGSFHVPVNGHAPTSTLELPKHVESMSSVRDSRTDIQPRPAEPWVAQNLESSSSERDQLKELDSRSVTSERTAGAEAGVELEPVAWKAGVHRERPRERASISEPVSLPLAESESQAEPEPEPDQAPQLVALLGPAPGASASLKDAFVRQLQLDRLTLRQMRSWLMSEDARRAAEVAAGATEAAYERLALILFGCELPELLGKPSAAPHNSGMSAEDRLELQREKARVRARLRRAAAKAARASSPGPSDR